MSFPPNSLQAGQPAERTDDLDQRVGWPYNLRDEQPESSRAELSSRRRRSISFVSNKAIYFDGPR